MATAIKSLLSPDGLHRTRVTGAAIFRMWRGCFFLCCLEENPKIDEVRLTGEPEPLERELRAF